MKQTIITKKSGIILERAIIIISLFFMTIFAQEQNDNLAVIDLGGSISEEESITLTDRLIGEMIRINKFVVIERSEMQEILKEQGFQQTGCTNSECAVEIGQLLGAQKMVAGTIGKVGDIYSIGIRIIDVQSGEILGMSSINVKGAIENVLIKGIKEAVSSMIDAYERRSWTPEDIEKDYKKRLTIKRIGAVSGTVLAAGSFAAGLFYVKKKSDFHESYSNSTLQSDMDGYFEKEQKSYTNAWIFSGAGLVFVPVSVFLYVKKIQRKELPSVLFNTSISPYGGALYFSCGF